MQINFHPPILLTPYHPSVTTNLPLQKQAISASSLIKIWAQFPPDSRCLLPVRSPQEQLLDGRLPTFTLRYQIPVLFYHTRSRVVWISQVQALHAGNRVILDEEVKARDGLVDVVRQDGFEVCRSGSGQPFAGRLVNLESVELTGRIHR